MKTYLFIFMAGCATIFFSYVAGVRMGCEKCRADIAADAGVLQSKSIEIMGAVNAETFNTGLGDIRNVLREKYTIAE